MINAEFLSQCSDALHSKESMNSNKYGAFKVTEVNSWNDVLIRFDLTGYELRTSSYSAVKGCVKDRMFPSVFGVGFIGDGPSKSSKNGVICDDYGIWYGMIRRCYSDKIQEKQPTYKGCTVHRKWHNFQTFSKWYKENHPNDGYKYHIDKDKILKGNMTYSEDTCCFLTPQENSEVSKSKTYLFISPDGVKVEIFNVSKFCREKNLTAPSMFKVASGILNHHKGWKRAEIKND